MRQTEKVSLKKAVRRIRKYLREYPVALTAYNKIDKLSLPSLQDLSFDGDFEFYKEVNFILTIITSIISKPRSISKREEIIARSDQANGLSAEAFRKTLADSSMWKEYDHKMIPENVYYYQFYDEYKTYENIFLVVLIDLINEQIRQYENFYFLILKALGTSSTLNVDKDAQEKAFKYIKDIRHKLDKIKHSWFYKIVSKAIERPRVIIPTNILLSDRLYNLCFKFYKKLTTYDEATSLNEDLKLYYFFLILKANKMGKFKMNKGMTVRLFDDGRVRYPRQMSFANDKYETTLYLQKVPGGFIFNFNVVGFDDTHNAGLMCSTTFDTLPNSVLDYFDEGCQVDAISIWSLYSLTDTNEEQVKIVSELDMINKFYKTHHFVIEGSEVVYSRYCPVCKSRDISETNNVYECPHCHSRYRFIKNPKKRNSHNIVFTYYRGM